MEIRVRLMIIIDYNVVCVTTITTISELKLQIVGLLVSGICWSPGNKKEGPLVRVVG